MGLCPPGTKALIPFIGVGLFSSIIAKKGKDLKGKAICPGK
jgi:hypothetical protein